MRTRFESTKKIQENLRLEQNRDSLLARRPNKGGHYTEAVSFLSPFENKEGCDALRSDLSVFNSLSIPTNL
jgi:hypothetical protein